MTGPGRRGGSRLRPRTRLLIAALLAGLALPPAAAATTFRAADNQVEDYPTVQALLFMDRYIREKSGGRHRIEVFHSGQLGDEQSTIEQTRRGVIDLDRINLSPLAAMVPAANAVLLPFQFRSPAHAQAVLDGEIGADILARFEAAGFVGLVFYDSGARSLYNSVRPVRTLADLAGLKVRVQQSELMVGMMQALGAVPVALAYNVVLPALELNVVDGAENNWPSYVTTGHYRAARYLTLTEHMVSPDVLVMSRKAWDGLSAEDRALVREAAVASRTYMRARWELWEAESRGKAASTAIIETAFDRPAFVAATQAVRDRYLADPELKALAARIDAAR